MRHKKKRGIKQIPKIQCLVCGYIGRSSNDGDEWICPDCGDITFLNDEALDYYYDEMLCNLSESEAGEVWDGYDD